MKWVRQDRDIDSLWDKMKYYTIYDILKKENVTQVELANKLGITTNNLNNKIQRNNFPMRELVEIASALGMNLMLVPKEEKVNNGYIINFPEEELFQSKRRKQD